MKTSAFRLLVASTLLLTLTLTSCAPYGPGYGYGPGGWGGYGSPTRADAAVGGALLGAAAGGIIGNQSRRGLQGAAIGGILGALAGNAIQQSRERRAYQGYGQPYNGYPQQQCPPSYNDGYGYDQGGYYPQQSYGRQTSYSPYGWH
ncbi:MAG: glycine zipper 2TM domain-containing protein [Verrucomicrobiaceae bacterium]|nr:glycine zipper 2TM domain-containing protein [Verrucomicrobiaceae bacterium]